MELDAWRLGLGNTAVLSTGGVTIGTTAIWTTTATPMSRSRACRVHLGLLVTADLLGGTGGTFTTGFTIRPRQ